MTDEHVALAAEAEVLDRAVRSAEGRLTPGTTAAVEDTYRYLSLRFLPHARADQERCARLASRDHHHPEGSCGEPEIEALTVRLDHVRTALAQDGSIEMVSNILRTLLLELRPLVQAHVGDVEGAPMEDAPSTARG